MKKTKIAIIEINLGADNFCYLCNSKGKRIMDIVDFMDCFNGKKVKIIVEEIK